MPLRPDLPSGLNLSRRATAPPVKLPKMSFPMLGGVSDQAGHAADPADAEGMAAGPEATFPGMAVPHHPQMLEQPGMACAPAMPIAAAPGPGAYAMPAMPVAGAAPGPGAYAVPTMPVAGAAPGPGAYAVPTMPVAGAAPVTTAPALPGVPGAQAARVIIYGRSGCQACMDAIRDLIDRQVCFTYYDVARDARAMAHLQTICGNEPMVPVIIQVGFSGA